MLIIKKHLYSISIFLQVNGRDFRCVQHEIAVGVLKASQEVDLLVARRHNTQPADNVNQT